MIKLQVYNKEGEAVAEQELDPKLFGLKVNASLIHQAAVAQSGNERAVLANTKDRSEVRGGGKKPWRQKGTGRARAGSSRSPIWIGGGVTFGPTKDRNFSKKLNTKMRKQALLMALSDRTSDNALVLLDKIELAEFKTKLFDKIITNLENKVIGKTDKKSKEEKAKKGSKARRSFLVMLDKSDRRLTHAGRNLAGVELINLDNINLLDILKYKHIVMTVEGVKKLEKTYSK